MMSTVYIVAGGPSLNNFDWRKLKGKNVLAINRAYEKIPSASYVYFSDQRFFEWHRDGLLAHKGQKYSAARMVDHKDIVKCKFTGRDGLDTEAYNLRNGNNSGHAAINLAYHFGYTDIVLLGYDMSFSKEGKSHWHDGYPVKNREAVFNKMAPYFDGIARELDNRNVNVINANTNSCLNAFPKIELGEFK